MKIRQNEISNANVIQSKQINENLEQIRYMVIKMKQICEHVDCILKKICTELSDKMIIIISFAKRKNAKSLITLFWVEFMRKDFHLLTMQFSFRIFFFLRSAKNREKQFYTQFTMNTSFERSSNANERLFKLVRCH